MAESNGLRPPPTSTRRQSGCIVTSCPVCIQTSGDLYRFVSVQSSKKFFEPHGVVISGTFDVLNSDGRNDDPGASALQGREPIFSEFPAEGHNFPQPAWTCRPVAAIRINRFRVIELIDSTIEQLIQHDSTIIQLYQLNPYDINNWFNNWFNRLFQILCPSHRRQMSLTSSQRFKAISWRISKNSLLPIENNVKHDMAENWDWDATRLVFWLSLLILMLKPFLLLKTALMHTSASWKHGPATLRCLLVCQDVERYCTVWFTWSSCQDLKKANCHL